MVLKRIVGALGNFLRRGTPSTTSTTAPPGGLGSILTKEGADVRVQRANQDLAEAIKTLSHSDTMVVQRPNIDSKLGSLDKLDVNTMPLEEVEELARQYFEGSAHIEKDVKKAFELWATASERGSLEAKYSRALCLKDGVGVDRDSTIAAEELRVLSDEKNYHLAHYSLALMYYLGDGVQQDFTEAFKLFKKAAIGGVTPALHNIGNCYADGKGVQQSEKNAVLYYQAADEAGDHFASFTLGTWYYNGKGGLPADHKKAVELQMKAAQRRHPGAMFNVGMALFLGDGVEKDKANSIQWLRHAAESGVVPARLNLAKIYLEDPLARQFDEAIDILQPIVDKNDAARELLAEIQRMRSSQP